MLLAHSNGAQAFAYTCTLSAMLCHMLLASHAAPWFNWWSKEVIMWRTSYQCSNMLCRDSTQWRECLLWSAQCIAKSCTCTWSLRPSCKLHDTKRLGSLIDTYLLHCILLSPEWVQMEMEWQWTQSTGQTSREISWTSCHDTCTPTDAWVHTKHHRCNLATETRINAWDGGPRAEQVAETGIVALTVARISSHSTRFTACNCWHSCKLLE